MQIFIKNDIIFYLEKMESSINNSHSKEINNKAAIDIFRLGNKPKSSSDIEPIFITILFYFQVIVTFIYVLFLFAMVFFNVLMKNLGYCYSCNFAWFCVNKAIYN